MDSSQREKLISRLDDLESIGSERVDSLFAEAHSTVFENTNCLSCANCCKNYSPIIEPDEIADLCLYIGISATELFQNYIEMDEEGDFVFKTQPCPMLNLEDNKCKIYENRPKACREYPHTNMKKIKNHLGLLEINIEICPAAEEIVRRVLNQIEHVQT